MQTDEGLIGKIADGDDEAFEILVHRYEKRLYNFALKMLGNSSDAEDALQDSFLKILRYSGRFNPRYRASTWMYTITRNTCLDLLRKKGRTKMVSLQQQTGADSDESMTLEKVLPDDSPGPAETSADEEILQRVKQAVDQLPESQRTVLILKEFEHLTCEEIAEVMACPVGTIKSRLHYGFQALKVAFHGLTEEA